ncbi:flagellar basal-body rod protein FlgF [Cysteiniphilum litorale]|uniref:flagellar basal-body rod protein FlgF n=1 Tax=Cysteiniphilum litorale TaxID=2056700 RepID=UPI003F88272E
MSSIYYNSLSGMQAASSGLDNVSNNMANMKTNGYKKRTQFFSELTKEHPDYLGQQTSQGVKSLGNSVNYQQGQIQKTGNKLDVALDGNGFFVLKKDGKTFYTRDGEFDFDHNGILVDKINGAHVQALDKNGALKDISITDEREIPGKPSSQIELSGKLALQEDKSTTPPTPGGDTPDKKYLPISQNITIYDQNGQEHQLTILLTPKKSDVPTPGVTTPHNWQISIKDEHGKTLQMTSQDEIQFDLMGQPQLGFNTVGFTYVNDNGQKQSITLNFGEPNSSKGVTQIDSSLTPGSNESKLEKTKDDGFGVGKLMDCQFDSNGQLVYQYSNGQTRKSDLIALANFSDLSTLNEISGNLFVSTDHAKPELSQAGVNGFGQIKTNSVELSNVDPSTEFADIIVYQRMFQACSEVMQVEKQMLENLYKNGGM